MKFLKQIKNPNFSKNSSENQNSNKKPHKIYVHDFIPNKKHKPRRIPQKNIPAQKSLHKKFQ